MYSLSTRGKSLHAAEVPLTAYYIGCSRKSCPRQIRLGMFASHKLKSSPEKSLQAHSVTLFAAQARVGALPWFDTPAEVSMCRADTPKTKLYS